MAVEARHLNLFPPQVIGNSREIMNTIQANAGNIYNSAQNLGAYGMPIPGTIASETLLPSPNFSPINFNNSNILPKTTTVKKSDSVITTYNNNNNINLQTTPFSRKRSRDQSFNQFLSYNPINYMNNSHLQQMAMNKNCTTDNPFSFLGEDVSLQIHQHQFDIDRLITQHMEKVRMEIEEKRKRQARRILEAIEIGLEKRLMAKEEEIEKIGKLNWALEERVKSLCVENQIWRDLAQKNEDTANALRTNLEQVLAQVKDERTHGGGLEPDDSNDVVPAGANELADDAQSCCGENYDFAVDGGWRPIAERNNNNNINKKGQNDVAQLEANNGNIRMCRSCGKEESCVLLMPCRHLCLCSVCGPSMHICPICKSLRNGTVNVNMS